MKILAKLLVSFLSIAALCAIVGLTGLAQLGNLNSNLTEISETGIPALEYLNTIDRSLKDLKVTIRSMGNPLAVDDKPTYTRYENNVKIYRETYAEAREKYEELPKTPEETRLYDIAVHSFEKAAEYNNVIIALVQEARASDEEKRAQIYDEVYKKLSGDERLVFDTLQNNLKDLLVYDQQYYGVDRPSAAMKNAKIGEMIVIIATGLSFIVAIILGFLQGTYMSKKITHTVKVLDAYSRGDFSEEIKTTATDEFKDVAKSLALVKENVSGMINDTSDLVRAAIEGKLSVRADPTKHQGGYRQIIEGINSTLDAVVDPLTMAAAYIDRISKGDLPERITEDYNGDFNKIKDNLNIAIESIRALIADTTMLADAAVEGNLTARADDAKHQGDYRKVIEGINTTLDLIIEPMNETTEIIKKMAEGDMTIRVTKERKGDFDILKSALNSALDAINDTMVQISNAVEQVAEGSVQVSQASQALSQGATEQASSLEEITSSTTEISSQTRQNTENAIKMNSLAKDAQDNAVKGNEKMKDLLSAMSDINTSAEQIKTVVKAIDDISFQINLLALNANVEAARAGKYGKGFAVVAEEVRNLAVRSANSVKETTRMVDEAISNIQRGNSLVDGTAQQLDQIVVGASEVSNIAAEVSTAGREQTQGLEQISLGLGQIDQVTQSNTASAEESASASEELSSQAQQVKAMLARFNLKKRESSRSDSDTIASLRAELASRDSGSSRPKKESTAIQRKPAIRPSEVISLDDSNFGKF